MYHAIYLEDLTAIELTEKLAQLFNISPRQISQIFKQGPTGIHVLVSDEVQFLMGLHSPLQKYWNNNANALVFCYTLKTFGFEINR